MVWMWAGVAFTVQVVAAFCTNITDKMLVGWKRKERLLGRNGTSPGPMLLTSLQVFPY